MTTNSRTENGDLDVIAKDIAALKSDIGKLMEHMKDGAAETVSSNAQRLYGTLAAEGERSTEAIIRHVEEKPLASLLIAFAVGFVGGQILRR